MIQFVNVQIFNEFNARKPDQVNIFEGVLKNQLFMGIIAVTIVLQVRLVKLRVWTVNNSKLCKLLFFFYFLFCFVVYMTGRDS